MINESLNATMSNYKEDLSQSNVLQKIKLPSFPCLDSDDLSPSWSSHNNPFFHTEKYQSNSKHSPNSHDQNQFNSDSIHHESFPIKSSVGIEQHLEHLSLRSSKHDVNKNRDAEKDNFTGNRSILHHGFSFGKQSLPQDQKTLPGSGGVADLTESGITGRHGFSFGRRSLSVDQKALQSLGYKGRSWRADSIEDEDDFEEEANVTDIYRSTGDIPGALLYKAERERRAVSQKIGSIGHAGQNLSLSHLLGYQGDDSILIPSRLQVHDTCFVVDEMSPIQTDIKWSPPDNATNFQRLVYELEFCDITEQTQKSEEHSWCPVASVHHPVVRVYRSESSLLLGKCRLKRFHHDTMFKLRVRAVGRLVRKTSHAQKLMGMIQGGQELSHRLAGEWSTDIFLTWVGWDNQERIEQFTSL